MSADNWTVCPRCLYRADAAESAAAEAAYAAYGKVSVEEFERLLDTGDDKDIQAFTQKQIPDLDQKIAAELLAFRQTYLNP